MVLGVTGCSLFSKGDRVKLGDYERKDPSGLTYDTRTVFKSEDFGADLADYASADAYPDVMIPCLTTGSRSRALRVPLSGPAAL